jgi:hypothetical protein
MTEEKGRGLPLQHFFWEITEWRAQKTWSECVRSWDIPWYTRRWTCLMKFVISQWKEGFSGHFWSNRWLLG